MGGEVWTNRRVRILSRSVCVHAARNALLRLDYGGEMVLQLHGTGP
jgi:hypothetical protein